MVLCWVVVVMAMTFMWRFDCFWVSLFILITSVSVDGFSTTLWLESNEQTNRSLCFPVDTWICILNRIFTNQLKLSWLLNSFKVSYPCRIWIPYSQWLQISNAKQQNIFSLMFWRPEIWNPEGTFLGSVGRGSNSCSPYFWAQSPITLNSTSSFIWRFSLSFCVIRVFTKWIF